jgi:thioredoxin-related protein
LAGAGEWSEDFAAAQSSAAREGKDLMLVFTGSDWCPACKALAREVLQQPSFQSEASKTFILVELDFPRMKQQSEKLKKQNADLFARYDLESFPSVVLTDASATMYAKGTYREGGPEKYIQVVKSQQARKLEYFELLNKAEKATGVKKAKLLEDAIQIEEKNGFDDGQESTLKQLVAADADGKAGLKKKYDMRLQIRELLHLPVTTPLETVQSIIEKLLADPDLTPRQKQLLFQVKAGIALRQGDKAQNIAFLKRALAADPASESGKMIEEYLKQITVAK